MRHSFFRASSAAGVALLLIGCARFELTGSGGVGGDGGGGDAPIGGDPTNGGAPPAGGGPVGGDPAGGGPPCTSDFDTDPFNCGSCGHDCYGGDCSEGRCQFEQLWSSNAMMNRFAQGVAIANDRVVWVCDAGTLSLEVTSPSGTIPITLSTVPGTRIAFSAPLTYRTYGTLRTTPLAADVVDDTVLNEEDGVWGSGQCNYDLALDENGDTYCVNSDGGVASVFRYNASFQATEVASGLPGGFGVAVDNTYFYVGTSAGIWRRDKPPSNEPGGYIFEVDVAAQLTRVGPFIYFGASDGLYRFNTADEAFELVYPDVVPNSIHVDETHIWFTNQNDEQVWRVDLDGSNAQTWGIGGGHPDVIAGDDLFVFVTTDDDGRLTRLAK
jgi:sugar lactone lactonase YvrE